MKRIVSLLFAIVILNGCFQSTSFIGPTYTLAKTGSIMQTGNSLAVSYGVKKKLKQINSKKNSNPHVDDDIRLCQTINTSLLSEIFFDTLDGMDCYRDPFSIFR